MQILRALKSPVRSYRKVREYGAGRVVLDQLKRYPMLQWHALGPIRCAKITVGAPGYFRRRRLAQELAKNSAFDNFFPRDTAYRVAPPGTFEAVDKIIPIAREIYRKFLQLNPSGKLDQSSYSYLLYDMSKPYDGVHTSNLRAHPEFLELACHRPFVEIAASYLGEIPVIGSIDFQVVAPNDHTAGFQRFHIDRVDRRQLKIFIAVEDVDEGNGATVIIPANKSAEIATAIGHRFGRIADQKIMSDEWRPHIQYAAGPAGTAFFFDTCRNIHCGARTRTRPRLLIMLQYVSKYSYAEPPSERGEIMLDPAMVKGDPVRELLFDFEHR